MRSRRTRRSKAGSQERSDQQDAGADLPILADLGGRDVTTAPAVRVMPDALNQLIERGYSEQDVAALVIPKRTLARRRAGDEPLTVEETDKALRLQRVASLAEQVFGDRVKAHRWLRKPKRALNGETPLAFLASEAGARTVEDMLRRIQYGLFA